ncbi:MAG: PAS domain-containing protein, partial [Chitinophagaceae bacterium]
MSAYSDNFNDRLLLDILQLSKDATAIYSDSELTIQFANAAMLGIWRKEASIIGMHLENAIPEIKDQPFIELLKNAWRTGETYEARDTRADLMVNGKLEPFYFDFVYRPLKNEEGKVFCILHTATEVSDRIMAWKAVADREESEKRLMLQLAASNEELQASNEDLAILNKEYQATNASLKQLNSAYNLLIKQLNENNITLGESGKSFRALIEQAPVAMMLVKGADLRIEMINAGMLELIGKDSSVTGKGLFEEMPELWGQPPAEMLFATFRTGKINRGESKQVNLYRNGELKACYFDFTYAPFLENGIVTGVIDIAVEVTEQVLSRMQKDQIIAEKTALEDTLRKSEQRLQGILDTMAEGVGITDATGKLIYANRMAQEIFGLTENETNVQSYNDPQWHNLRIDGSPLADNEHPMAIMMRTGKPIYDHEIAIQPPDGERKYISVNAAPIFNEEGELTGGIGTFMNVTSRRLITQQKDDFIS